MKLSYKLVISAFLLTLFGSLVWSANHYHSKYQREKKRADEAVQNAESATAITNNVLQSMQIINTVLEAIWHVRTLTLDGLVGLNPIAYAREAISLAAATEEHGARLFSNGAVTSGVLRTEQTLSDQAYERLKKDFEERHTGLGNAHRPMILEMGLDWKSMALNAEDSQFLETRKFQLEEICRLFRVPLHMVQNTDRATFNNIEELGLGFINYSLVPYLTRIEQRINTGLVRKSKQGVYYAKFNAGALLRGDMKSRFEAYATGINWGIYSPNDCRDLEDMNPRPGGDVYLTPMNMTTKPSDGSKAGKQKDNANADETTS